MPKRLPPPIPNLSEIDQQALELSRRCFAPQTSFSDFLAHCTSRDDPETAARSKKAWEGDLATARQRSRELIESAIQAEKYKELSPALKFWRGEGDPHMDFEDSWSIEAEEEEPDQSDLVRDLLLRIGMEVRDAVIHGNTTFFGQIVSEIKRLKKNVHMLPNKRVGRILRPSVLDGILDPKSKKLSIEQVVEQCFRRLEKKFNGVRLPFYEELLEAIDEISDASPSNILDAIRALGLGHLPRKPKTSRKNRKKPILS